jgi:hypothetical protein
MSERQPDPERPWHRGWPRYGDQVMYFHPSCAGCGRNLGLGCIVIGDEEYPPEPEWPFPVDGCPLCALRVDHDKPDPYFDALEQIADSTHLTRHELKAIATKALREP